MADYKVVRDNEYGFLRIDPTPSREEVARFYKEEFYSTEYKAFNDSTLEAQEEALEFNRTRYRQLLEIALPNEDQRAGKKLFDIGCGFGDLLKYASEQGLECSGVEASPEAAEHLRSLGFDIRIGDIESDYPNRGQRYDVVTLLNVLEHLRDPARMIRFIGRELLAPDGTLVVEVPNDFNSFQKAADAEHGLGEWWIAPPGHLNYFNPDSLTRLLEGSGYEVADTLSSFPLEIFLLMGEVYVGDPELGKSCHLRRCKFEETLIKHGREKELLNLYRAFAGLNLGRQVICFAKPDPYMISEPARQTER